MPTSGADLLGGDKTAAGCPQDTAPPFPPSLVGTYRRQRAESSSSSFPRHRCRNGAHRLREECVDYDRDRDRPRRAFRRPALTACRCRNSAFDDHNGRGATDQRCPQRHRKHSHRSPGHGET